MLTLTTPPAPPSQRRLGVGLTLTIIAKIVFLIVMQQLFFSEKHKVKPSPEQVGQQLLASPSQPKE